MVYLDLRIDKPTMQHFYAAESTPASTKKIYRNAYKIYFIFSFNLALVLTKSSVRVDFSFMEFLFDLRLVLNSDFFIF